LQKKKKSFPWVAQISHNNKMFHLGYFKIEKEAAIAYDKKANELFGEFARLNFSQSQAPKQEKP